MEAHNNASAIDNGQRFRSSLLIPIASEYSVDDSGGIFRKTDTSAFTEPDSLRTRILPYSSPSLSLTIKD
jgi:hypothetical protein